MLAEDAGAATAAAHEALSRLYPEEGTPAQAAVRATAQRARALHLQTTDPEGCWVAEVDGQVVGVALGLVRDGVWGFSLFGILPAFQGMGIGNRLYAAALAYGAEQPGGIILSSSHPAAMRRYARSPGFRLLPSVGLSGAWDPRRVPEGLRSRPGDLSGDAETLDRASRHVRGASHAVDLPVLLGRPGAVLLVLEGAGFAVVGDGTVALLAATSEAAAEDLLWSAMRSGPRGGTVSYDFVTAENQWAIRVGLEAGLALTPDGPVLVRGQVGPMAPYLPSGAYL
jgi:GNAT superfamily N-acetyltransferase